MLEKPMKETRAVVVNDVFNALLFGLPQGILLGLVWIAYCVWTTVRMRGLPPFQFSSRSR